MENKVVRCTFYGHRSVYDADLRMRMHREIERVIEENDSLEFLFYLKDATYLMFLSEIMLLKAAHPEKEIRLIKVISPEEDPTTDIAIKRLYFVNRYDSELPLSIFDGLNVAGAYKGKAKKDSPGYMMLRFHSIERWIFAQCDVIFTYCYPAFAESESFEIELLEKKDKKKVIPLTSEKTTNRIIELANGLDERNRDFLTKLWKGESYAQIGIKYGITGGAVKGAASRASRQIREGLRRDYLKATKSEKEVQPGACGLIGFGKQSELYIHDIILILRFLSTAFNVQEIYVEQDICFTNLVGALFPKNAITYTEHKLIAVLDPRKTVEENISTNSYCPPYHSMSFVGSTSLDENITEVSMYEHIAEHCQFIITDFKAVRHKDELIECCAKSGTRLIDVSSIPSKE